MIINYLNKRLCEGTVLTSIYFNFNECFRKKKRKFIFSHRSHMDQSHRVVADMDPFDIIFRREESDKPVALVSGIIKSKLVYLFFFPKINKPEEKKQKNYKIKGIRYHIIGFPGR